MTKALWMGCGLTSSCHKQHRRKGGHLSGDLPCQCHDDLRIGRKAHHGAPGRHHQPAHTRSRHGGLSTSLVGPSYGGIQTSTHGGRERGPAHVWHWDGVRYRHLEPQGQREIAPGQLVSYQGKPFGRTGWHETPHDPHVVHAPPQPRTRRAHTLPGVSTKVAGHYSWSPVLGKHVWVKSHDTLSLDPSQLPAAIRGPVMQAIKSSLGHTHAHTAWGVTGHRVWVIPGHWQWDKSARTWKYIERHVDSAGRPHAVSYGPDKAPSAAYGPRPGYLPPLHFWPHGGQFRDAHGRAPADAPKTLTMPPHAQFAHRNGLLGGAAAPPLPTGAGGTTGLHAYLSKFGANPIATGAAEAIAIGVYRQTGSMSQAQAAGLRALQQSQGQIQADTRAKARAFFA